MAVGALLTAPGARVAWERSFLSGLGAGPTNQGGTSVGLLDEPISCESLVDACRKYDKSKDNKRYNQSLDRFRTYIEIDIEAPKSQDHLDLSKEDQCEALIDLLLNPWQCRQPNPILSPEPSDGEELVIRKTERNARLIAGLVDWWDETHEVRCRVPSDLRLSAATDADLDRVAQSFTGLASIDTGDEIGYVHTFSNVPASKTLYAWRPRLFMAWDKAIKKKCWIPQVGSAFHFVQFHKKARMKLQALQNETEDLERCISEATGRVCTEAEALNKYLFVKSRT